MTRQPRRVLTASLAAAAVALPGCARPASGVGSITLGSAYVIEADGLTAVDAYVAIRNSGPADHLLQVTSSAGGTVILTGQRAHDAGSARQGATGLLAVPANRTIRLMPNGVHLVILHSGLIHQGEFITLTLTFARGGAVRVPAEVTNLSGRRNGAGQGSS